MDTWGAHSSRAILYVPASGGHVVEVPRGDNLRKCEAGILLEGLDIGNELGSRNAAHEKMLLLPIRNLEEESTVVQLGHRILVVGTVRLANDVHAIIHLRVRGIVTLFGEIHRFALLFNRINIIPLNESP